VKDEADSVGIDEEEEDVVKDDEEEEDAVHIVVGVVGDVDDRKEQVEVVQQEA